MTSTSFTAAQCRSVLDLKRAWPNHPIVLVGASALACSLEMYWRRTNDLDLTIVAEPAEVAIKLVELGWVRDIRLEQRWTTPHEVRVDILPVSATDLSDRRLIFAESGQIMNLTGFDLALKHHFDVELDETTSIAVATVPVIVLLKMTAWLDRPFDRDRDLEDLAYVLEDYIDSGNERRWQDDIIEAKISFENQPAFALGQDIRRLTTDEHRAIIRKFLDALTDDGSPYHASFAKHFRRSPVARNEASTMLAARLEAFRRGLGVPF